MASGEELSVRRPDEGSTLVVALLGLVAVLAVGGVAVLTIRTETAVLGRAREARIAYYAAAAGAEAGLDYASRSCVTGVGYDALIGATLPTSNFGNQTGADSGGSEASAEPYFAEDGNVGTESDSTTDAEVDNDAYYDVTFVNNQNDPSASATNDEDQVIVIRSTGYGPNGAQALIMTAYRADSCSITLSGDYAQDAGSSKAYDFAVDTSVVETTSY